MYTRVGLARGFTNLKWRLQYFKLCNFIFNVAAYSIRVFRSISNVTIKIAIDVSNLLLKNTFIKIKNANYNVEIRHSVCNDFIGATPMWRKLI